MRHRIRLTESDLHRIVKESVKHILNEKYSDYFDYKRCGKQNKKYSDYDDYKRYGKNPDVAPDKFEDPEGFLKWIRMKNP